MVKTQTQADSVQAYKAVYTIVWNYGLQNEAVQSAIEYYRNEGFEMEVECAIHAVNNQLFHGRDEY